MRLDPATKVFAPVLVANLRYTWSLRLTASGWYGFGIPGDTVEKQARRKPAPATNVQADGGASPQMVTRWARDCLCRTDARRAAAWPSIVSPLTDPPVISGVSLGRGGAGPLLGPLLAARRNTRLQPGLGEQPARHFPGRSENRGRSRRCRGARRCDGPCSRQGDLLAAAEQPFGPALCGAAGTAGDRWEDLGPFEALRTRSGLGMVGQSAVSTSSRGESTACPLCPSRSPLWRNLRHFPCAPG